MDMSIAIEVGERIKQRLKDRHLNQKEAAISMGLDPSTFNTYCSGKREASYSTLITIAKYLGCTPNDLLGEPSSIKRELFNDIVAAVTQFMTDYRRELPPSRLGPLYWAIYDTVEAEPERMLDENGKIQPVILTGLMRSALSL